MLDRPTSSATTQYVFNPRFRLLLLPVSDVPGQLQIQMCPWQRLEGPW
jgi:hypothetical protein